MNLRRLIKHLAIPDWLARRGFSPADLNAVTNAIARSERSHRGEIRFVIEGALPVAALLRDIPARQRAIDLFSELRVWDTADNSGILIYVQLIDHQVEILADRGINACVEQVEWDAICHDMKTAFRQQQWGSGAVHAIEQASELLAKHFPAGEHNPNELPDSPLVI
jgi:uncharacterized membrane protein